MSEKFCIKCEFHYTFCGHHKCQHPKAGALLEHIPPNLIGGERTYQSEFCDHLRRISFLNGPVCGPLANWFEPKLPKINKKWYQFWRK